MTDGRLVNNKQKESQPNCGVIHLFAPGAQSSFLQFFHAQNDRVDRSDFSSCLFDWLNPIVALNPA
jgi:hypothetical protein